MKIKLYEIEIPGQDAEHIRGTAKVAQKRLRQIHKSGLRATLRRIDNKAEQKAIKLQSAA